MSEIGTPICPDFGIFPISDIQILAHYCTVIISRHMFLQNVSQFWKKYPDFRHYTSVWKLNYSGMQKSESPITEQRRNPYVFVFELAVFGFRLFGPKLYRSDFGHAKLDRFIYKGGHKQKNL